MIKIINGPLQFLFKLTQQLPETEVELDYCNGSIFKSIGY